ncbi:MAG: ferredoxin [Rhodospirillales bacterium]
MPPVSFSELETAVAAAGLILRGGFHPRAEDAVPGDPATLILVGNAGPAFWHAFTRERRNEKSPMDAWTKRTVETFAAGLGARAMYPFEGPPYLPFQHWAQHCEPVHPSPIGALIHPVYGLWHAYRAALAFDEKISLPEKGTAPSPCDTCADKPCLNTCPVGAFTPNSSPVSYNVPACADFLASTEGEDCLDFGCAARRACPVGRDYIYPPAQARFHMDAFNMAHGRAD